MKPITADITASASNHVRHDNSSNKISGFISGHKVSKVHIDRHSRYLLSTDQYHNEYKKLGGSVDAIELDDLRKLPTSCCKKKYAMVINKEISEEEAKSLWTADIDTWPLLSNSTFYRNFSSVSFYLPTEQLTKIIENHLLQNIPSLDLTYKDFFELLKKSEPTVEILIVGGLVRDSIKTIINGINIKPVDVDIQITLTNEKTLGSAMPSERTIQSIVKPILINSAKNKNKNSDIVSFLNDHFLEFDTGYVAIGDCKNELYLDMFNANAFTLNNNDRTDFTVNSFSYRYSEEKPFLISKSQMACHDIMNSQLRFNYNTFDTINACTAKPSDIPRYLYFRSQKGYKKPNDKGLTNYALQLAINHQIKISTSNDKDLIKTKKGGQYYQQMKRIRAGCRLYRGAKDHGSVIFEKDISRITDKFFSKKINKPEQAMSALLILKDDFNYYSREFLLFAELIKALLDNLDTDHTFRAVSANIIQAMHREHIGSQSRMSLSLDHLIPVADLFTLMLEIMAALPSSLSQQLKLELNQFMVDTNSQFEYSTFHSIIIKYLSYSIPSAVKWKIQYLVLCMESLMTNTTKNEAQSWV